MLVYVHNRKVTMQYSLGSRLTVQMQTLYTNIENTSILKFYLWQFFFKVIKCWIVGIKVGIQLVTSPQH